MLNDKAKSTDTVIAATSVGANPQAAAKAGGVFHVQCHDAQGNLKWEAKEHNLVVNVGLQDMNTKYFTGSAYTATWYLGLYGASGTNNPAATDTMASHAGWTEVTAYAQASRPQAVFGTATALDPSTISNTVSPAVYTISSSTTVGGAFLTSSNDKGGNTGILFSAVDFSSPGNRDVVADDTLTLTYTFSLDAA